MTISLPREQLFNNSLRLRRQTFCSTMVQVMSPVRRQTISWTNAHLLSTGSVGTNETSEKFYQNKTLFTWRHRLQNLGFTVLMASPTIRRALVYRGGLATWRHGPGPDAVHHECCMLPSGPAGDMHQASHKNYTHTYMEATWTALRFMAVIRQPRWWQRNHRATDHSNFFTCSLSQ